MQTEKIIEKLENIEKIISDNKKYLWLNKDEVECLDNLLQLHRYDMGENKNYDSILFKILEFKDRQALEN